MPKIKDLVLQLPDGRKLCFKCRKYKGASFFSTACWNAVGSKICCACQSEDNKKEKSQRKIKGPDPDIPWRSFRLDLKKI